MADDMGASDGTGNRQQPALDEVMMAMDVVDTLRHNESLALRELAGEGRDDALKEQLRRIYESQGLAVSDRILDEGIRALNESRFVYMPRGSAMSRGLAELWLRRAVIGKWLGIVFCLAVLGFGWGSWRDAQTRRQIEAAQVEITQTLPQKLQKSFDAAFAEARTDDARTAATGLLADGTAAVGRSDAPAARSAVAALEHLREQLVQTYVLRIVSRPGEQSGIFRIPDVNTKARNYYLIVEAVGPDGKPVSMPVTSEENGSVRTVAKWAVRVPQTTYDSVRRDKQDDGILQKNVLGSKPRGALKPVYDMEVMNGAITEW